jgi:hypothetical protein
MQLARHNRRRRAVLYAVATVIVGMISLTLAQCVNVGDKTTGVTLRHSPTNCIKQCNDQYKILFDQEQKLHQTNIENCQALPQPDRGSCLAAEDARHQARMAELGQAKIDCQNNCHHQGGGTGG